jgi:hypothetical protein
MSVGSAARLAAAHSMRAYYVAIVGGAMLVVSAFLPWLVLGDVGIGGVPDIAGLWVLGLGILAIVLASLSIYTRKNSRHPLLLVGLVALGILFLAYEWLQRVAVEQAWARTQAIAIVDNVNPGQAPATAVGQGVYLGMTGALLLVTFGLTIVVKRVASPYAEPEDDDV